MSLHINGHRAEDFKFEVYTNYKFTGAKDKKVETTRNLHVVMRWRDKRGDVQELAFTIDRGYDWNGADIPKLFAKAMGGRYHPSFLLGSCLHDFVIEQRLLASYPESRMFYEVLKTRKGKINLPKWKEKAFYYMVYAWSLIS